MEGTPEAGSELPLKVCPHCSVASRTEAETCPNCGKSYVRSGFSLRNVEWSWWFAIPIVIVAFAIGYFGISQLIDGDETGVITAEQAEAVEQGVTRDELIDALDGEQPAATDQDCLIYSIDDPPPKVKTFCFVEDKYVPTPIEPVPGGQGQGAVPAPPDAP